MAGTKQSKRRVTSGDRCVSCGKPIELGPSGYPNHHCSRAHEAAKEAANRAHEETPKPRRRSYGQRLAEGFEMLGEDDG